VGRDRIGRSSSSAAGGPLIWIKPAARSRPLRSARPVPDQGAPLKTLRQLLTGADIIQLVIRLGLLALLIVWAFILIRPFVPILVWGVVLAVALNPVFNGLAKFLGGRPKLAAIILTLINLAIIIGPAAWIGLNAVEGLKDF